MSNNAVRSALRAAAKIIEPPGKWCQFVSARDGACCMMEAIARAAALHPLAVYRDARDRIAKHLGMEYPTAFNDAPGRTQGECVAALRAAAEAL